MGVTYTIGTLSELTGLSQHTIRAWERRYRALTPTRSETNRRIYDDEDLERLNLLKNATETGHSIGLVAGLTTDRLRDLTQGMRPISLPNATEHGGAKAHLSNCLSAIGRLDSDGLADALVRANAAMGVMEFLTEVAIPLLAAIEVGWLDGSIRISQEHLASAVLKEHLQRVRASMPGSPRSPRLLVTTPRHQHHEFGALMAAIVGSLQSWRVTYLGPDLPMQEIADAVRMISARAVALSLVFPLDDVQLAEELRQLRRHVGPALPIIIGGRIAPSYTPVIEEIGAQICTDLQDFGTLLDSIK